MIELLVNWEENGNFHLYAEQHQMITLLNSDCPLLLSFIANQVRLQLLNKYASTLWSSPQHSANKIRGRKVRNLSSLENKSVILDFWWLAQAAKDSGYILVWI